MRRDRWLVLLAVVITAAGCHKSDTTPMSAPPPVADTNAQAAAPDQPTPGPPPVSAPAPDTTVASTDVGELTRQLRKWTMRNQRMPRDFQDFASTAGFQIPPPPAGKKYEIKRANMSVVLVNQ